MGSAMKCIEIVFSPTGGTRKVADILATELSGEVVLVDLSDKKGDFASVNIDSDGMALIAMPCFGGRAPRVSMERLACMRGGGARAVVVSVYGNRAFDDALVEMVDGAREAGFDVIAAVAAVAEHSIMPQYASGRPVLADENLLAAIGREIRGALDGDRPVNAMPVPGDRPYKTSGAVPLVPQVKKTCTACGRCVANCPVGAIDSATLKADKDRCITCMRCLKECPVQARAINGLLVKAAAGAIKKQASAWKEPELFAVPE